MFLTIYTVAFSINISIKLLTEDESIFDASDDIQSSVSQSKFIRIHSLKLYQRKKNTYNITTCLAEVFN